MIKLVAMDMDGTLLNSSKRLPEENKAVIEEYSAKGVEFAFCTGRVMNEMELISGELPCVKYAITCNGAYVNDLTIKKLDNEIFNDTLDMDDVRRIFELVKNTGVDMMFEIQSDGVVYAEEYCINNTEKFGVGYIDKLIKDTRVPVDSMQEFIDKRTKSVGKINIFFPSADIRNKALEQLKNENFDFSYSESTNLEINKSGANKGKGLKMLADYLGLGLDEIMAIGDNYNDIDLLKTAGCSVVMANAPEEIKVYAKYETLTNDENGVAYAIRKFC